MKNPPIIKDIRDVALPKVKKYEHAGVPCYYIQGGPNEIIKLQFIFPAGRKFERMATQARMTNMLLKEGCGEHDSKDFATLVDNYGFVLKVSLDLDFAYITLICLKRFFNEGLALVMEMITKPHFNEADVSRIANVSAQSLHAQLEKNELVSYREFTKNIFGASHIYGYNTEPEDFSKITKSDLEAFHAEYYALSRMKIILSGDITDEILEKLHFGDRFVPTQFKYSDIMPLAPVRINVPARKDLQVAIKMGKKLFSRQHPDYPDVFILNTILGGYFGSRLMRNIREDKGYAYNVYSVVETMTHDGYLSINCEVGKDHVSDTFSEIEKEMNRLKEEEIPALEMKMVRNYMLGQMMHSLDGPFASAEMLTSLISNRLDLDFLRNMVDRIKLITTFELRSIAQKHLMLEDFTSVVVGAYK